MPAERELAWIIPVDPRRPGRPDNSLPDGGDEVEVAPPIQLPPLPPGQVAPPIVLPPRGERPENPIFIPPTPTNPIVLPPGTVWPPLDPSDGVDGTGLLFIWVVGTDKYRWVSVSLPSLLPTPK